MTKIILAAAFFISIAFCPWWASTLCAVLFLAEGGSPLAVLAGGFVLDALFGAPIAALGGFSYLYTLLFGMLAAVALYLRSTLFE